MADPNWWLENVGVPKAAAIASFIGAVMSLRSVVAASPLTKLGMVGGGTLAAINVAPFIVTVMKIQDGRDAWIGGLGFFLGLFGISLIDVIAKSIQDGSIWAALRGRIGL